MTLLAGSSLRRLMAAVLGYILSPLSWWNDLLVNVPLAYAFSYPFSYMNPTWYLPSFIAGYWLTNLLGFFLMHWGISGLLSRHTSRPSPIRYIIVTLVYSMIIVILVLNEWIPIPTELIPETK